MHIPQSFHNRLKAEFQGRFRIRWSDVRGEFHLEQKLASAQILEPPLRPDGTWNTYDDEYIRSRDGYGYVMSVRQGDRMPCMRCRRTVKVPIRETREAVCLVCNKRHKAAFYPLDDLLLLHLKWIDPLSGGIDRVRRYVNERNAMHDKSRHNDTFNEIDAATADNFGRLFDIKQVGYTGRERYQ